MATKKKSKKKAVIGLSNGSEINKGELNLLNTKDESYVASDTVTNLHAKALSEAPDKSKKFSINDRLVTTAERLNVREAPHASGKKIFDLANGTQVIPVFNVEGWFRVLTLDRNPRLGYVSETFVEAV